MSHELMTDPCEDCGLVCECGSIPNHICPKELEELREKAWQYEDLCE